MIVQIVYHKNIFQLYPVEWIDMFRNSVLNQTRKDFVIYELNYGGGDERVFKHSQFESLEMPTFVHAMNYLLDEAFVNGANVALNANVDDYFSLNRVEVQVPLIEQGYDLVSSNFSLVQDGNTIKTHEFHTMDIESELDRGHNIICHPCVAYSRRFWENNQYDPADIPLEDLNLWKKAIRDHSFYVTPEVLLYHRLHRNSVCNSNNR